MTINFCSVVCAVLVEIIQIISNSTTRFLSRYLDLPVIDIQCYCHVSKDQSVVFKLMKYNGWIQWRSGWRELLGPWRRSFVHMSERRLDSSHVYCWMPLKSYLSHLVGLPCRLAVLYQTKCYTLTRRYSVMSDYRGVSRNLRKDTLPFSPFSCLPLFTHLTSFPFPYLPRSGPLNSARG